MKGVILAGGSGSRLWPVSRQHLPKQFLSLDGEATLLDATMNRLAPMLEKQDIWIVTSEGHATGEAFADLETLNTILEPCGRNTAPAIAVAAALLQKFSDEDPMMVVLPADHMIQHVEAFQQCLKKAADLANNQRLVTFGIIPDYPETGFGYIQAEKPSNQSQGLDVLRFVEKPDVDTAKSMLEEGGYYWNSGMFVWKASVILEEIQTHLPELWQVIERMQQRWQSEPWQEVVRHEFASMPNVSIDYGVMEQSTRVSLVPADIGWSDVGSWDAVYDISDKDKQGNTISGDVVALNCQNSLLRSQSRLIAAAGLEDVIAVETPDAILLVKRGESQQVKQLVEALKQRGDNLHLEHVTVRRPWGSYTVLENAAGYKMKRIEVKPGASLSLQSHQHRSEHWIVVSGTATVTRDDEVMTVSKNESTYISIGVKHRLQNKGKVLLQMIEVQVGDYLEEDDIERFDDEYGRVG